MKLRKIWLSNWQKCDMDGTGTYKDFNKLEDDQFTEVFVFTKEELEELWNSFKTDAWNFRHKEGVGFHDFNLHEPSFDDWFRRRMREIDFE